MLPLHCLEMSYQVQNSQILDAAWNCSTLPSRHTLPAKMYLRVLIFYGLQCLSFAACITLLLLLITQSITGDLSFCLS